MLLETVAFPAMSQRAAAAVQTNKYKHYLGITIYLHCNKGWHALKKTKIHI